MNRRTVLITGATSGIGRHAAVELARRGHRVIATGRSDVALDALRKEAAGIGLLTLPMDVTDEATILAARESVDRLTDGAGVDVLVNNAGWNLAAPLESVSDADLRSQFDTNVFGLMAVTRTFLPGMRRRRWGRIINIGSMFGRVTFPFMGAYHATKYAVEALSDALRMELAPCGIAVVIVEPGLIRTQLADRAMRVLQKYRTPDSPYAAILEHAEHQRTLLDRVSVGPECVTRAIRHAVESTRPHARYVVPFQSHFVLIAFSLLPTRWMDGLVHLALRRAAEGGTKRLAGNAGP